MTHRSRANGTTGNGMTVLMADGLGRTGSAGQAQPDRLSRDAYSPQPDRLSRDAYAPQPNTPLMNPLKELPTLLDISWMKIGMYRRRAQPQATQRSERRKK